MPVSFILLIFAFPTFFCVFIQELRRKSANVVIVEDKASELRHHSRQSSTAAASFCGPAAVSSLGSPQSPECGESTL